MTEVVLRELGLVCALGEGKDAVRKALLEGNAPGMRRDARYSATGLALSNGRVDAPLPDIAHAPPKFRSRNNQLLLAALEQIRSPVDSVIKKHGPARIGVVLGTSTSGVAEAEAAFLHQKDGKLPEAFHYGQMEIGSPSEFLSSELGLCGPSYTVSTACSSSAKALLSAKRLLAAGLCDAVLAGGADSLCRFTNAGFSALEALSPDPCLPFSDQRHGINIGEAAVLFLVTNEGPGPRLAGGGESSDAHHISAPQPEGLGAAAAMRQALETAGLRPDQISYLNAHGTATQQNDAMESRAIADVLGSSTPVSSTKTLSGHTLGAAGALEAAFCWLLLTGQGPGRLPAQLGLGEDPSLPSLNLVKPGQQAGQPLVALMSNSFGFGGSNASLILTAQP
jgi:3-oxoacyl-[acyl-carrier-protein] synthase-1